MKSSKKCTTPLLISREGEIESHNKGSVNLEKVDENLALTKTKLNLVEPVRVTNKKRSLFNDKVDTVSITAIDLVCEVLTRCTPSPYWFDSNQYHKKRSLFNDI